MAVVVLKDRGGGSKSCDAMLISGSERGCFGRRFYAQIKTDGNQPHSCCRFWLRDNGRRPCAAGMLQGALVGAAPEAAIT